MNTGEFITALFNNLGVSVDDAALKDIVTKIATTEISDDLVSKFNQGYMTEASAKANPKIANHFKAQHYNGLDDELKPLYDELELPDNVKSELLSITSSTKRAAALTRKVKELTEAKAGASKGDKEGLNEKITALNNEIAQIKIQAKTEIENANKSFDSKVNDLYLSQFLSSQKYASDGYKDEDFLLPKTKIEKALIEKGLIKKLEGKDFKLQTADGVDYFENNTKVDFKSFSEKVLSDNKLLALSEPADRTKTTTIVTGNTDRNKLAGLAAFDERISEATAQIIL